MTFKAVMMDFYGTLVEEDDAIISRICQQIASTSPMQPSVKEIAKSWRFSEWCDKSFGTNFQTQRQLEQESLRQLLAEFESDLCPVQLSQELFDYWQSPTSFPETNTFLKHLQLPVCIVSNIDLCDIQSAITFNNWSFTEIVTSQCALAYKPRPEMFEMALDRMSLKAEQVLHVGDSWRSDVIGAQMCGISVAYVNRKQRALPTALPQDVHEVAGLMDVLAICD